MKRGQAAGAAPAGREGRAGYGVLSGDSVGKAERRSGPSGAAESGGEAEPGGKASGQAARLKRTGGRDLGPLFRVARAAALGILIAVLGAPGCYSTPQPECGFICGANATCPGDYICGANNRCRLPSVAEEQCPGVLPPADARMDAPMDARMDAPPQPVCVDLAPVDDGTGRQALLLSELSPTVFIELFNATGAALTLDQGDWGLQARGVTFLLKDLAPVVTVPAHGYANFPWPAALLAGDAGGELALYSGVTVAADFDDQTKLVGYACWGTDAEIARKQLAEDGGKWMGDCAAALSMSALRRKVATKGISAADFAADVAADKTACEP